MVFTVKLESKPFTDLKKKKKKGKVQSSFGEVWEKDEIAWVEYGKESE